MQRFYVPSLGPADWRRLLADPASQWERKKSALEMAVCWEGARDTPRGLPPEVASAIDSFPALRGAEMLIGIPEHKVSFEGGGHPSQNDLWGLLRTAGQLVSLTVEAKAGEKLDDLVRDWLPKEREGEKEKTPSRKPERLAALQRRLGVTGEDVSGIRYQLLHRTASAILEAERFAAAWAAMLVQSFNRDADEESYQDFVRFGRLMEAEVGDGVLVPSARDTSVPLLLGWVSCKPADIDRLSAAV